MTVAGVADKEKSGVGAGIDPPLPQEVRARPMRVEHAQSTFERERISTTPALSVKHRPTCLSVSPRQIEITPGRGVICHGDVLVSVIVVQYGSG